MITNYKLFENISKENKWDRVDNYLKMIRKNFNQDTSWDNFMNIDPSNNLANQDIILFIIYSFNNYTKLIYEMFLKYDLFVEDQPHNDELIIIDIYSHFNSISDSNIENMKIWFPQKYEKIIKRLKSNKFNL
jgi:hypothetical protein